MNEKKRPLVPAAIAFLFLFTGYFISSFAEQPKIKTVSLSLFLLSSVLILAATLCRSRFLQIFITSAYYFGFIAAAFEVPACGDGWQATWIRCFFRMAAIGVCLEILSKHIKKEPGPCLHDKKAAMLLRCSRRELR